MFVYSIQNDLIFVDIEMVEHIWKKKKTEKKKTTEAIFSMPCDSRSTKLPDAVSNTNNNNRIRMYERTKHIRSKNIYIIYMF